MPDFNKKQKAIAQARKAYEKAREIHYRKKLSLQSTVKPGASAEIHRKLKPSLDKLKGAQARLEAALEAFNVEFSIKDAVAQLDASFPILFLPVRIETRFMPPENPTHLWVRIYPDDIFVHSHEEELTRNEVLHGQDYWKKLVKAIRENETDKEEQKKSAWKFLKNKAGVQRALWIARSTIPSNWKADLQVAEDSIIFPQHEDIKSHDWTRAPRTDILPDRFVVKLIRNNENIKTVIGRPVPDEVFLGPDPYLTEEAYRKTGQSIEFDSSFSWINNFDEAIEKGLGIKIKLNPNFFNRGQIDRLDVVGIQMSATPEESKERLEKLIAGHHYSKGFSFVPQKSATNNDGKSPSFYSPDEDYLPKGYYEGPKVFDLENMEHAAANNFSEYLGIDPEPLREINNGNMTEMHHAQAMNTALYSGTIGPFIEEYLDPVIPKKFHDEIRSFFTNYVTASGPFPAFCVGNQPYGILVTSNISSWKDSEVFYNGYKEVLQELRVIWDSISAKDVAYVGKNGDPNEIMLDILGLHGGSVTFSQRMGNLAEFLLSSSKSASTKRQLQEKQQSIVKFLQNLGYPQGDKGFPLISNMYFYDRVTNVPSDMLVDGKMPATNRHLQKISKEKSNYLFWLANVNSIKDLDQHLISDNPPRQVLYLLLRYALLQTLKKTSQKLYEKENILVNPMAMHKSLYNFDSKLNDLFDKEVLYSPPGKLGNQNLAINKPMGDHILTLPGNIKETLHLRNMRKALKTLSTLDTASLHKLLCDHFDLGSYRLDAWETGLYYRRLLQKRREKPKGLYLGAYGWVEGLKPAGFEEAHPDPALKTQSNQKVFKSHANAGFVQTPSLNHATAAGVLMSGYINHASKDNANVFAVNLSSERMRRAMHVYEGVRNNQRLEALLGYQFERALHDITSANPADNLNQYILELREKYPLDNASIPQQGNEAQETISPFSVIDGLKIIQAKASDIKEIIGNAQRSNLVLKEKDRLEDTLDALNDLMVSEVAFHATQGKTDRTSAFLNTFNFAEMPPEVEVLDTPRSTQLSIHNKVMVHFDSAAGNPENWAAQDSPRKRAEPGINHWLGTVLGNPQHIVCEVSQVSPDNIISHTEKISLNNLQITPIDLVYLGGEDVETTLREWQYFVLRQYRELQVVPSKNKIKVEFEPAGLGSNEQGFINIIPLVRELRKFLTISRAGSAQDFMPVINRDKEGPERIEGWDVVDLKSRVQQALIELKSLNRTLRQKAPNSTQPKNKNNPASIGDLIGHFLEEANPKLYLKKISFTDSAIDTMENFTFASSLFGVKVTFPELTDRKNSEDIMTLTTAVIGAASSIESKITRAEAALDKVDSTESIEKKVEILREASSSVLGDDFNIVPRFKYQNKEVIKTALAEANQGELLKYVREKESMSDDLIMESWLDGISRVRENMNRLERIRLISEARGASEINFMPSQIPPNEKNTWLALEFPDKDPDTGEPIKLAEETICLSIHGEHARKTEQEQCVLIIDEWTEFIPNKKEITGVTYNYNQPNATAPNALLLAIEPTGSKKWNWDVVTGILNNTLQRVKSRAVEPAQLMKDPAMENLIPMTVAPFDLYDAGISLDFGIANDKVLSRMKNKDFNLYNYFKL